MATQKLQQPIIDILNARLQDEYNAERFYIAASLWCDLNGFEIASEYFVKEYKDERKHAHKLQKYASNWNVKLLLPTVSADPDFSDIKAIAQAAYDIEVALYDSYCADVKAIGEVLPQAELFLYEFVQIQNDAVVSYSDILKKLEGIEGKFELLQVEEKIFK